MSKYVGESRTANCGQPYVVEKVEGRHTKGPNFRVRFTDTGSTKVVTDAAVRNGTLRDSYAPSVAGVGYLGTPLLGAKSRAYRIWHNMINRCYNSNSTEYKRYGTKGVTVCERWHCFEYFVDDLPHVDGYDEDLFDGGELFLDKDIKQQGFCTKVYSARTCVFVSALENSNEASKPIRYKFKAISPSGVETTHENIAQFSKTNGLSSSRVGEHIRGKVKRITYKGWKFERV
jgi:hypothetical protein